MTKQSTTTPFVLSLLAGGVVAAGLASLGFWQLDRADFKRDLETARANTGDAPVDVLSAKAKSRFQPVVASGRYLSDRQILIDNMVEQGRNGFFVVTPFELDGGDVILVNRGWIAQDPARRVKPDVAVAESRRHIEGLSGTLPVAGLKLAEPAPAVTEWPYVAAFPTLTDVSAWLGVPVREPVLLLASDQRDGFVRDWRLGGIPASRHTGYAVQWFALAIAALAMFTYFGYRQSRHD